MKFFISYKQANVSVTIKLNNKEEAIERAKKLALTNDLCFVFKGTRFVNAYKRRAA